MTDPECANLAGGPFEYLSLFVYLATSSRNHEGPPNSTVTGSLLASLPQVWEGATTAEAVLPIKQLRKTVQMTTLIARHTRIQ
jgi:hypothetical protein